MLPAHLSRATVILPRNFTRKSLLLDSKYAWSHEVYLSCTTGLFPFESLDEMRKQEGALTVQALLALSSTEGIQMLRPQADQSEY